MIDNDSAGLDDPWVAAVSTVLRRAARIRFGPEGTGGGIGSFLAGYSRHPSVTPELLIEIAINRIRSNDVCRPAARPGHE